MPTAPQPGSVDRKKRKRAGYRVTVYGQTDELQLRDLGPSDTGLVRETTGRSLNSYLRDLDIDSVAIIRWLSRRKAGERKLTLAAVFKEMPSWFEFVEDDTGMHDIEILEDVDEAAGENGDGEGILDVDSDEVDPHPLPAGGS